MEKKGGFCMTEFLTAMGNYGFPMAVTAFLLVRVESKLGMLSDNIQLLAKAIDKIQHT